MIVMITRLYRRASANLAFVRTGRAGAKVIKDGGTLVVPVVHQVIPVSLETMRLNVERRGHARADHQGQPARRSFGRVLHQGAGQR